jgi:parvulin-like peptidyl-prolyl isomerase
LKMKKRKLQSAVIHVLFIGLCLPLWMGCGSNNSDPNRSSVKSGLAKKLGLAKKEDKVVLRVEDTTYLNSDFEKYVGSIVGENQSELTAPSLSRLYDKFVEEKLLLRAARDRNIILSEEEKKSYLIRLNDAAWSEDKKKVPGAPETQNIFEKLLIEKYNYELIKDIKVDEAEISQYYELNKKEFLESERVKVSQILLETEEKAVEVYNKVNNASEEEFRKMAGVVSAGPEAIKGGEMGVFKVGELPF